MAQRTACGSLVGGGGRTRSTHVLGMWLHGSAATIGAPCSAWMARTTARRAKHVPMDSVWSSGSGV